MKKFCVFCLIATMLNYFPINFAVKEIQDDGRDYIFVKQTKVTGFSWFKVGEDGEFDEYILLKGNTPPNFDLVNRLYDTENIFVCWGKYGEKEVVDGEVSAVFYVDEWEIMYPIKRNSVLPDFLNPQYARNIWDYIW